MKDKSFLFFLCVLVLFLLFGSVLFYRVSPETLPERAKVALRTANFRGMAAAFDGDRAFLLGEATSEDKLSQAAEVLGKVEGIASVDISHATVKKPLASPHMSLAFVGNQISARGKVATSATKLQILANLQEHFPEAKIDHNRLVVRNGIEDYREFGKAPLSIPGVGARERERGIVAAVGGDIAWQVMPSGEGTKKIKAALSKVLPPSEVDETLDEFDDELTAQSLRDNATDLAGELKAREVELAAKNAEANSLTAELETTREALGEVAADAHATEMALTVTQGELAKRESELTGVRTELMVTVKQLAEATGQLGIAEAESSGLKRQLEVKGEALAKMEAVLNKNRAEVAGAHKAIEKLNVEKRQMEAEVTQLGSELHKGKSEKATSEKEADARIAEVETKLAEAEAEVRNRESKIEAMAAQHAAESEATDRQLEAVKSESDAAVTKLRGEVQQLEGKLLEATEKAAEMEAKFMSTTGPVRPAPTSVTEAAGSSALREKEVDAVRGAAATAADRARASAEDSVERTEALRLRNQKAKPAAKSGNEPPPSGKPIPFAEIKTSKLDVERRFSSKNFGIEPVDAGGAEFRAKTDTDALKEQLEERDQRIKKLEERIEASEETENETINKLQVENLMLRDALNRLQQEESEPADADNPGEKDEVSPGDTNDSESSGDPFEEAFANFERRLDGATELGFFGDEEADQAAVEESAAAVELAVAFEEIASLQSKIAQLEIGLAESLLAQSEALESTRELTGRAETPAIVLSEMGNLAEIGDFEKRPEALGRRLRSILVY